MKKKHPEHVNLERWLVSYADFMTLLFALFVVLYATSQADMSKIKKFSASVRNAFSNEPAGMLDLSGSSGGQTLNLFENEAIEGGRVSNLPAGKTNTATEPDSELRDLQELLEETISLDLGVVDDSKKLQMEFDSRGLIVRIAVKNFFDPGSVVVKPDLLPTLDRIGFVLSKVHRLVRLEGHSDASETHPGFESDWEFSAARAAWIVHYWMKHHPFDPERLGIAGYGHFRPLTQKLDPYQQAKNRRVEIIILNNHYMQHNEHLLK